MEPLEIEPSASDSDEECSPVIARDRNLRTGPPDPALRLALPSEDPAYATSSTSPGDPISSIHLTLPPQRSINEPHEPANPNYSVPKPTYAGSPGSSSTIAAPARLGLSSETEARTLGRADVLSVGTSPVRSRETNLHSSTSRTELEVGYRSTGLDLALDSLRTPAASMVALAPGAASVPRSSPSSDEDPFDALVAEAVARSTRAAAELARTRLGLTGLGYGSSALAPAAPFSTGTSISTASPSRAAASAARSPLTKLIGELAGGGGEPESGAGDRERPALKAELKLHFDDNVTSASASDVGMYTVEYSIIFRVYS